jgi:PGF-CTERM protein
MTDTTEPGEGCGHSRATRRRVLQATAGALVVGTVSGRGAAQQADGPTVYVGSRDSKVYAVDAGTGTEQWAFEIGDNVESSPTVVNGTVYVGSFDHNLYAVDAAEGEREWAFETGGEVWSSPTVVNDPESGNDGSSTESGNDGSGPGFGVGGALAGLGGAGYLLKHRLSAEDPADENS